MIDGQTDWATRLTSKLKATLTPGEQVTVVRLSPRTAQSRELWSGCWPQFTAEQRARIAGETYILSASPLSRIGDQQKYFVHDLGVALTAIYTDAKRPAASVQFTGDHAPPKQIIRALASDEGRFANSQRTVRAIVYSDMAENSDLGSVFQPGAAPAANLGQTLGSYLRRSVFYAYGVGDDVTNNPGFAESAKRFWTAAFKSLSATLAGMGSDLNVANALPVRAWSSPITMSFDGQDLDGRVSLLADADGTLVDSWVGISRLGTAALSGTFRCAPAGACRLEATTTTGLATNAPAETLTLSGPAAAMTGQLGLRTQKLSYPVKTTPES